MHITFLPIRSDDPLVLERHEDVLVINGEAFDLSPLPEGGLLTQEAVASPWVVGDITRQAGRLSLTLLLPHGASAPDACLFPQALIIEANGLIALPDQTPQKDVV